MKADFEWLKRGLADGSITETGRTNMAAFIQDCRPESEKLPDPMTAAYGQWVSIPMPPSANRMWRSVVIQGKVRVMKSKMYRRWAGEAEQVLSIEMPKLSGPVSVHIRVGGKKFNRNRDLDNCIKPVIDAIRYAGRIDNDNVKTVRSVSAEFLPNGPQRCEVMVLTFGE